MLHLCSVHILHSFPYTVMLVVSCLFLFFLTVTYQQPPPPPGRGFQPKCKEDVAYGDRDNPQLAALFEEFAANAPPNYTPIQVVPSVNPGSIAHRVTVHYTVPGEPRCEDIDNVFHNINAFKSQNAVIGNIAVALEVTRCLTKNVASVAQVVTVAPSITFGVSQYFLNLWIPFCDSMHKMHSITLLFLQRNPSPQSQYQNQGRHRISGAPVQFVKILAHFQCNM